MEFAHPNVTCISPSTQKRLAFPSRKEERQKSRFGIGKRSAPQTKWVLKLASVPVVVELDGTG
jgi:hypothetical protein